MRKKIFILIRTFIGITIICFLAGCKKEYRCRRCIDPNKPPVANAGKDTTLILPVNSILLDGSASADADGSIISYQWSKLSGNSSYFRIADDKAPQTLLTDLAEGEYIITLEVKDNNLVPSKDVVVINVRR